MKRNPDALDRLAPIFEPPGRGLEDLLRRRDKRERTRRVGAIVLVTALVATFVALGLGAVDGRNSQPADPTPTASGTALRQDGKVITYTGGDPWSKGDLVAADPGSGEVRTLVAAGELGPRQVPGEATIGGAVWSADGRWVAFEILGCDDGSTGGGLAGLWATNGQDGPHQLTTRPCSEDPKAYVHDELWEWAPAGAQLVVARRSIEDDELVVIDPATGDRANLGSVAGAVTSLAWSPDGTRIVYGAAPTGPGEIYPRAGQGSVYSVGVGGGEHALLASSVGLVSGGETGSGIRWSPDGARIAVLTEAAPRNRLYLMNADGSDLELLTDDVVIEHTLGSPNLWWSPDGTRMAYATFSGERGRLQIWNGSPDGSAPVLVFESPPAAGSGIYIAGGPVWSPDGTWIAFRYDPTEKEANWLVAKADGTGRTREIDELRYMSWRGGWYFCECYG